MVTEALRLFDPSEFSRDVPQHPEFSPELQAAVDNFMQHVELDPGDPGYEVTEDGVVLNHYIRRYDPFYFGDKADALEIAWIEKKLGELDILVAFQGVEFLRHIDGEYKAETEE